MNVIIIELCAEDRARIDRLAAALERKTCDSCVASALTWAEQVRACQEAAKEKDIDPVQQKLAETLANVTEPPASPEDHPVDQELPWSEPDPVPVPSLAEFQKALSLRCAESDATKAKVRELLHEYAPAASKVPEDKRAEVLERLAKL